MASSSVMNAYALMEQDDSILEIRLKPENGWQYAIRRSYEDGILIKKTPVTPPPVPRVSPLCPPPLRLRRQGAIMPESPIEHDICTPPRHCCIPCNSGTGTLVAEDTPVAEQQQPQRPQVPIVPKLNLPARLNPEDDTDDEEDYTDMPPLIPAREIHTEWPSRGLGCADPRELFSRWESDENEYEYPDVSHLLPRSLFSEPISTSHHMFFDDEGNQITQAEFRQQQQQQQEEPWSVNLPSLEGQLVARHPKVLLAFFEFVEANNEFAQGDEHIMFPAIDSELVEYIETHPFFNQPNYEKATLKMYLAKYGEAR